MSSRIKEGGQIITSSTESSPSYTIVDAIATLENIPVEEVPPLYHFISPEALDKLIDSGSDSVDVSFDIDKYSIQVNGSGKVSVAKNQPF